MSKATHNLNVRCTAEEKAAFEAACARMDRHPSDMVRHLMKGLVNYAKKHDKFCTPIELVGPGEESVKIGRPGQCPTGDGVAPGRAPRATRATA